MAGSRATELTVGPPHHSQKAVPLFPPQPQGVLLVPSQSGHYFHTE